MTQKSLKYINVFIKQTPNTFPFCLKRWSGIIFSGCCYWHRESFSESVHYKFSESVNYKLS